MVTAGQKWSLLPKNGNSDVTVLKISKFCRRELRRREAPAAPRGSAIFWRRFRGESPVSWTFMIAVRLVTSDHQRDLSRHSNHHSTSLTKRKLIIRWMYTATASPYFDRSDRRARTADATLNWNV
jgi:hypothetical protein